MWGDLKLPPINLHNVWPSKYMMELYGDDMNNKYQREIKPGVFVDVYDVLKAFDVTCPAMAHGVKKCLAPGQRGVKDSIQDKSEAIASIKRSIEMELSFSKGDNNAKQN